jgi:hypothetical protein
MKRKLDKLKESLLADYIKTGFSYYQKLLSFIENGGDLDLHDNNEPLPEGTRLPKEFIYNTIDLSHSSLDILPDGLTVNGTLDLTESTITSLPKRLKVGGDLYLFNSTIKFLPNGLTVGNTLDLGESDITELPKRLKVGRHLHLDCTRVKELPKDLEVGFSLYLEDSHIMSIPSTIKVGEDLILYNTPIGRKYTEEDLKEILVNVKGDIKIESEYD